MKKLRLTVILSLVLILLSSCNITSFDTNNFLSAPLMSPEDQEMRKAISDAIGKSYEPVYPKTGNYQTAITSYDITGDGKNEAVCFYKAATEQNVSLVILRNENEKWQSAGIVKTQAYGVDKIAFCELSGDNKKELVIGLQYLSGQENALEIYSLSKSEAIESVYTGMYNDFIIHDNCMTVISKNSAAKTASASLIGNVNGSIAVINTVSLNNSIAGFSKIQTSEFSSDTTLIYLDEELESHTYTTELLSVTKKENPTLTAINLENKTNRIKSYTCIDADSDGLLDLPVEVPLPAYIRNETEDRLSYVKWHKITNSGLEYIKSTYCSINEPFYIKLPESWTSSITIERNSGSERIIHFYTIENKQPMFSIRVFSRQEYTNSAESDIWQEIAAVGENVYTYRKDGNNLPDIFETDIEILKNLFVIIS